MFGLLLPLVLSSYLASASAPQSCAGDQAREELRSFLVSDEEIDRRKCAESLGALADRYRDREGREKSCCREFWRNQRAEAEAYLTSRAEACAQPAAQVASSSCAEGASQAQCLDSNRRLYEESRRRELALASSAERAERRAEQRAACSQRTEGVLGRDGQRIRQALEAAPDGATRARILAGERL